MDVNFGECYRWHQRQQKDDAVKNVLFVCSQNKLRSPTAEQVFASWPNIEASSAGTNNDAENPLSAELIEWADIVFVMEKTIGVKFRPNIAPLSKANGSSA